MIKIKFLTRKFCIISLRSTFLWEKGRIRIRMVLVTNESGRPKNIRIRNTGINHDKNYPLWGLLGLKLSLPA